MDSFFKKWGLRPLGQTELEELVDFWEKEVEKSLADPESRKRSLEGRLLGKLRLGNGRVLVLEVGGSKWRIGWVERGGIKKIGKAPFPKREWILADWLNFLTLGVRRRFAKRQFAALGVVFSFPGEAVFSGQGLDLRSVGSLPKGWQIKGLSGKLVGAELRKSLVTGGFDFDRPKGLVLNDVMAVLVSQREALVAGVVGTGFNLALNWQGRLWNLEAGDFKLPRVLESKLLGEYDRQTRNKGKYLLEKVMAGPGVAGRGKLFLTAAVEEGFLPAEVLAWRALDLFNLARRRNWQEFRGAELTLSQKAFLEKTAKILIERAASVLASLLAGALRGKISGFRKLVIPLEGSFFWKTEGFESLVERRLEFLLPGIEVSFWGKGKSVGFWGIRKVFFAQN